MNELITAIVFVNFVFTSIFYRIHHLQASPINGRDEYRTRLKLRNLFRDMTNTKGVSGQRIRGLKLLLNERLLLFTLNRFSYRSIFILLRCEHRQIVSQFKQTPELVAVLGEHYFTSVRKIELEIRWVTAELVRIDFQLLFFKLK